MNNKYKQIVTGGLIITTITSAGLGYKAYASYLDVKQFNENLIKQVQELQDSQVKITDIYYEQIQEKNKSCVSLNVFDSEYATFKTTLKEDKVINPLESTTSLKWKYKVDLDMIGMEVINKDEYIEINIDPSLITISDVIIDTPTSKSDTNFFNQFRGKAIEEINNKSIKSAYQLIQILAKEDYSKKYESIVKNIAAKLSYVYGVEQKYMKVNILEDSNV